MVIRIEHNDNDNNNIGNILITIVKLVLLPLSLKPKFAIIIIGTMTLSHHLEQ